MEGEGGGREGGREGEGERGREGEERRKEGRVTLIIIHIQKEEESEKRKNIQGTYTHVLKQILPFMRFHLQV